MPPEKCQNSREAKAKVKRTWIEHNGSVMCDYWVVPKLGLDGPMCMRQSVCNQRCHKNSTEAVKWKIESERKKLCDWNFKWKRIEIKIDFLWEIVLKENVQFAGVKDDVFNLWSCQHSTAGVCWNWCQIWNLRNWLFCWMADRCDLIVFWWQFGMKFVKSCEWTRANDWMIVHKQMRFVELSELTFWNLCCFRQWFND